MGRKTDGASWMLAPSAGLTSRNVKVLTGAGTTEDVNDTALTKGKMATLKNGAVPIDVRISSSDSGTAQVTINGGLQLGAFERFDWWVEDDEDQYVHTESTDGSSTHYATLWESSPISP